MTWCNAYGVCKNPNKFGEDIVLDLVIADENDSDKDEHVAAIQLDKEAVQDLIDTLKYYVGE